MMLPEVLVTAVTVDSKRVVERGVTGKLKE